MNESLLKPSNILKTLIAVLFLATPALSQSKILFLGDSLTAGYGIPKENAFPDLVYTQLKSEGWDDLIIVNAGISGSTTASGVSRLRWHLRSKPIPKVVVLALGANDGLRGQKLKHSRDNLLATITLAKSKGIKVLMAGMKIPPNYGKKYAEDFETMFKKVAKDQNVALIPFLLEGVAAVPKLNLADGIHPNQEGHKIVAKTVAKHIKPLLPKKGKSP